MIPRILEATLRRTLREQRKIIILYGARQVGKTTLVRQLLSEESLRTLVVNADQMRYNEVLSSRDLPKMMELIGDHELLFLDEAQRIQDIGINLKILHDSVPDLKIIATGSSSFELANQVREPLTGRTRTFHLFPVSVEELSAVHPRFELRHALGAYLRFGMYPEVLELEGKDQKVAHLRELSTANLYRDVLQLSNIKHSDKVQRLLKLLAFQVGSLVSVHELAKSLQISHETVDHYIDLLEKGFVLFRLSGFSRNPRKEVTKMSKIYFYDLGIRNALINDFNLLEDRNDVGALWENFLVVERKKKLAYANDYSDTYFWRTYSGVELDYVEEESGKVRGYEFKYRPPKARKPIAWQRAYPKASFQQVDRENFLDFVM